MQGTETQRDQDKRLIEESIKREYPDAHDFSFTDVGREIFGGRSYYIEFKSEELEKKKAYYYAYVDREGCKLLDGEQDVIEFFEGLYNRRRALLDKLRDFEILDVVTAILAVIVVTAYVVAVFYWRAEESWPMQDGLQSVVAAIIGYYFGRANS